MYHLTIRCRNDEIAFQYVIRDLNETSTSMVMSEVGIFNKSPEYFWLMWFLPAKLALSPADPNFGFTVEDRNFNIQYVPLTSIYTRIEG